jgi:hypothetical protein
MAMKIQIEILSGCPLDTLTRSSHPQNPSQVVPGDPGIKLWAKIPEYAFMYF